MHLEFVSTGDVPVSPPPRPITAVRRDEHDTAWLTGQAKARASLPFCADTGCISIKTLSARIWVFCAPTSWGRDGRSRLRVGPPDPRGRPGRAYPHMHAMRYGGDRQAPAAGVRHEESYHPQRSAPGAPWRLRAPTRLRVSWDTNRGA